MLRPKSSAGYMVSDFVDERNGYLALTEKSSIEHCRQTQGLKNKHDVYSSTANPRKDIGLAKNS